MTPDRVLVEVSEILQRAGIPYMVTGSFASSMLGIPRSTRDLDMVISPSESQIEGLIQAFDPDTWYIDPFVVREQGDALDFGYLERWARELSVEDLLAKIRA
ncbi:MAG TPA: hypothetical protein PKO15_14640 [Fibrobacteria bacterium]|nr:hypothetical protein [Fibrobacteria bacterium]